METVKCTLCGSVDHGVLETRARFGMKANTVICRRCGLVFLNPRMTPAEYEQFYSSSAYRKLYSNAERPTKVLDERSLRGAREKFLFVSGAIDLSGFSRKKFLDIGCSAGYLPFIFSQHGWESDGIEPTKTFAEHGRKKFGLDIKTGMLNSVSIRKKYSLITMVHVFEHMTDPHATLKKIRNILAEDGLVYIEVPNVQEFYGRFSQGCDIAHPYFYSPQTLRAVLAASGFDVVKMVCGSSVRAFAKKGTAARLLVDDYAKTMSVLQRQRRSYYTKGYFFFTPACETVTNLLAKHDRLANFFKKIARMYSKTRLPFSRALHQLGVFE